MADRKKEFLSLHFSSCFSKCFCICKNRNIKDVRKTNGISVWVCIWLSIYYSLFVLCALLCVYRHLCSSHAWASFSIFSANSQWAFWILELPAEVCSPEGTVHLVNMVSTTASRGLTDT